MKSIFSTYVLVREGLSTDDVGMARNTAFQEIRPWAGFKTGDFVKKKLGELDRRLTPNILPYSLECAIPRLSSLAFCYSLPHHHPIRY